MHLDEDIEHQGLRLVVQTPQVVIIERRNNEQNRIGTGDRRLVDLHFVNREILAQQRRVGKPRNLREITQRPLEVFFIGQNRKARRSTVEISPRLSHGIEIRINEPDRWRGLLHLRNDPEARRPAIDRGAEAPKVVALQRGTAQMGGPRHQGLDFKALGGDNLCKLVGHGVPKGIPDCAAKEQGNFANFDLRPPATRCTNPPRNLRRGRSSVVERHLAKVDVVSSNLIARSISHHFGNGSNPSASAEKLSANFSL